MLLLLQNPKLSSWIRGQLQAMALLAQGTSARSKVSASVLALRRLYNLMSACELEVIRSISSMKNTTLNSSFKEGRVQAITCGNSAPGILARDSLPT